jgi:hypothetical protein
MATPTPMSSRWMSQFWCVVGKAEDKIPGFSRRTGSL